jgi:hypothetical protein
MWKSSLTDSTQTETLASRSRNQSLTVCPLAISKV